MPKINLGKVVGDKGDSFTFDDFTPEQLDGITPKLLKGNVTTLDPDENVTIDIRKDGVNNYIDFGIPRGKNGAEIKKVSASNVELEEDNTLDAPIYDDTVGTYTSLFTANEAAETSTNKIKSGLGLLATLSNAKKSLSAIVQGLKILGTNVGAINGITSDINSESTTIAASSKMVHDLNASLSQINSDLNWKSLGVTTGDNIIDLPEHKELWVLISFQSKLNISRSLYIARTLAFETDIIGFVNGDIDYVHIFYHISSIGMMSTSNAFGTKNFAMRVFYR